MSQTGPGGGGRGVHATCSESGQPTAAPQSRSRHTRPGASTRAAPVLAVMGMARAEGKGTPGRPRPSCLTPQCGGGPAPGLCPARGVWGQVKGWGSCCPGAWVALPRPLPGRCQLLSVTGLPVWRADPACNCRDMALWALLRGGGSSLWSASLFSLNVKGFVMSPCF